MLKIYKNKTPNARGGKHYIFTNFANFTRELGMPFLQIQPNDYRINNGSIIINTNAPYSDVDNITYVIDSHDNYYRCYFVNSAMIQSGNIILNVEVDLWGSYIAKTTFSKMRVNRCNRNVGIGVYDPIQVTKNPQYVDLQNTFLLDNLAIVYVVSYATGISTILVNNASSAIGVFANWYSDFGVTNRYLDKGIELVSGIYSANGTLGDFDSNVIKAYLLPIDVINGKLTPEMQPVPVPVFNTKTPNFSGTLRPTEELAPSIIRKHFDISITPNKEYYVGTRGAGLKLVRTTEETIGIDYEFHVTQDGVQVLVKQGDKMLDITSAFQIGLTSNDGNFTSQQAIAKTLQTIGGVASGAFQIASGGAGSVTGAMQVTSAIMGVLGTTNSKYTQGGDGVSTFRNLAGGVRNPYVVQTYESTDDEEANARLFGASFNQYVADFEELFDYTLMGRNVDGTNDTYVAMDCIVEGVCSEAREYITSEMNAGVYVTLL